MRMCSSHQRDHRRPKSLTEHIHDICTLHTGRNRMALTLYILLDVNHFWEKSEVQEGGKLIRRQLLSVPSHTPFSLLSELQNSQILMRDFTHKYELTEKWVNCLDRLLFSAVGKRCSANVCAVKMIALKANCHSLALSLCKCAAVLCHHKQLLCQAYISKFILK